MWPPISCEYATGTVIRKSRLHLSDCQMKCRMWSPIRGATEVPNGASSQLLPEAPQKCGSWAGHKHNGKHTAMHTLRIFWNGREDTWTTRHDETYCATPLIPMPNVTNHKQPTVPTRKCRNVAVCEYDTVIMMNELKKKLFQPRETKYSNNCENAHIDGTPLAWPLMSAFTHT